MILLEVENALINENLLNKESKQVNKLDTTFSDFSHCEGWLHAAAEGGEVRLSLRLPAWKAIAEREDCLATLKSAFPDEIWMPKAEDGWNVSLSAKSEEHYRHFSRLRAEIIAAPLKTAIKAQQSGQPFAPLTINLSPDGGEAMTVACVANEQVVCVFSTHFADESDMVLAKVFLQELFDTRKNGGMSLGDAPAVLFGNEAPSDVASLIPKKKSAAAGELAYISLVLFPRHFGNERVWQVVPMLRDYLHYHLKCCKAYLHGRMRAKTADFLKILNRAHLFE